MNVFNREILLYTIVIFKYLPVLQKDERQRWTEYCRDDYTKCPNCFGEMNEFTIATFLDNVTIDSSFDLEVGSLFGNRRIQYGIAHDRRVILKHLISDEIFHNLRNRFCSGKSNCEMIWKNTIRDDQEAFKVALRRLFEQKESVAGFQICPIDSMTKFMEIFSERTVYDWLLLNLNVEPLIMNTLRRRHFPVPSSYDSCGFVRIVSNNGLPLYSFYDKSFAVRLLIAKHLLSAALKFSYGVEGFRIYLTDATPDNIVVDGNTFDVTFVDLDNLFVVDSTTLTKGRTIHRQEKIDCDGMCFAYVPDDLCAHHLSDINLFAICQLFVDDPNRMPDKGLLHSVPEDTISISASADLQRLVNECVEGGIDGDRFITCNYSAKYKFTLQLLSKDKREGMERRSRLYIARLEFGQINNFETLFSRNHQNESNEELA